VCAHCLGGVTPLVGEHFCSICGTPFLNRTSLDELSRCGLCRLGETRFDAAFAFGEYDGILRRLIQIFKYDGVQPLAGPLSRLLARAVPRSQRFDMVVPMPLHWLRRWKRGFNQAGLLSGLLAKQLGVPSAPVVRRVKSTAPQAGLTVAQRRDNLSGAFRVRDRATVAGKQVLLIDDVLTTGATVNACAAVLKRAGARRVTVLTVARADRRRIALAGSLSELESGELTE
jgi:ComF family protein